MSGQRHAAAALPPGVRPIGQHSLDIWVALRTDLGFFGRENSPGHSTVATPPAVVFFLTKSTFKPLETSIYGLISGTVNTTTLSRALLFFGVQDLPLIPNLHEEFSANNEKLRNKSNPLTFRWFSQVFTFFVPIR